ncbi:hypothetical protein [Paenibacillus radicis (ex Gao et al. 2016)]|uniref:Sporulation protein n=1 Tax=Paenibacillus radicis (ex Gao et al. 2016) TaxID=1737354 RepID=A0A917MB80_9BACL|nr:hypothetical protein [Paenibacillus radicis (ex Gao et al. 2016)]GGG86717.1 hypothetical protein GCM10010918_51160 [Paenibacillus radicis (ex Gao et al. 2016)]
MAHKGYASNNIKRTMIGAAAFAVLALCLSGCASNPSTRQAKTYGHDGYMGYSNSNPNIPNNFSYLNYKSDGKFAGDVLKQLKDDGVKSNQLYFNGEYLRVLLHVDSRLSDAEVDRLRQKAQNLVQYNMPRYKVTTEIAH